MIKIILFIQCFLVSSLFAEITEKNVLSELMAIHGSNWNGLMPVESEKNEQKKLIKDILVKIINKEINPTHFGYKSEQHDMIRNNAISEFGHFTDTNDLGNLTEKDKKVFSDFEKSIDNFSKKDALSYYDGLKNAATPDSLEKLSQFLRETSNLATLYTIEKSLLISLEGSPEKVAGLDNSYITPYKPRIKNPYDQRDGDWTQSLTKIKENLKYANKVVQSKSKSEGFKKTFSDLLNNIEKMKPVTKLKSSLKESPEKKKEAKTVDVKNAEEKNSKREISSEEENDNSLSFLFYSFLGLMFLFLVWKKVRS